MPPRWLPPFLALLALGPPEVLSHSHLAHILINGALYQGFDPRSGLGNHPERVGWFNTATDDGFVPPSNYSTPDIICHRDGASPRGHAPVAAGEKVLVQWNGWPVGHVGPILTYLAPCGGLAGDEQGCTGVDKTALRWSKIDDSKPAFQMLPRGVRAPGRATFPPGQYWATDMLVAANNSWTVVVPSWVKPGPYVLRQEIIALHYAARPDGAQNYPVCVNLWVEPPKEGPGPERGFALDRHDAREFYREDHPGVLIDVMKMVETTATYVVPGPTLVRGATPLPHRQQARSLSWFPGTPVAVTRGTETFRMEMPAATTEAGAALAKTAGSPTATPTVTKRWKGRMERNG
ncbi:hypothetical protein VTJ83DRAFT_2695 [Remersonia thermophila]|uniref:lytic cellulose monooxygenase (C4-dehydrogenating) n=1 Tax=Remersonia thermophila TaxID=72144 RepID=A0ABR4DJE8_9PEZI